MDDRDLDEFDKFYLLLTVLTLTTKFNANNYLYLSHRSVDRKIQLKPR